MKKLVLVVACAFCMLSASAQIVNSRSSITKTVKSDKEKATWGLRAGLNVANMKESWYGESESYGARMGYHVGVILDIPVVSQYFYIQPGLYLTQKGYKDSEDGYTDKANPTYVEIPILLSGRYNITNSVQAQLHLGPYFAVGVFGNFTEEYKDEWSESYGCWDDTDFKRFDCGLSFGAGFLFSKHYYIGFQYDFGLMNLSDYGDGSIKNRNCMISLGYNF
ncbi:MAG: PorT family protein [Prevotella sp.]|nr:PorT family protein [Prevotella sp.]